MAKGKTAGAKGKLTESLLKNILSAYAESGRDPSSELLQFLAITSDPTLTKEIVLKMYHDAVEEKDADLPPSPGIMG